MASESLTVTCDSADATIVEVLAMIDSGTVEDSNTATSISIGIGIIIILRVLGTFLATDLSFVVVVILMTVVVVGMVKV